MGGWSTLLCIPTLNRFMWIMGFCIPMSVRSALRRGTTLPAMLWKVLFRSAKLFALGFFHSNISEEKLATSFLGIWVFFFAILVHLHSNCDLW